MKLQSTPTGSNTIIVTTYARHPRLYYGVKSNKNNFMCESVGMFCPDEISSYVNTNILAKLDKNNNLVYLYDDHGYKVYSSYDNKNRVIFTIDILGNTEFYIYFNKINDTTYEIRDGKEERIMYKNNSKTYKL